MSDVVVTETLSETVERQAKEIERLRKEVIHWREARRSCIAAGDMMKAEIERLRESADAAHKVADDLEAEIERLRDLLAEALDSEISDYWYVRVGEALGR